MPRRSRPLLVLALVAGTPLATLAAQGQPAPQATPAMSHDDAGHAIPWKALDAYHTVMAASWHPAKKSDDLAPFRSRASALVAAARALAAEPVPAACGGSKHADDVQALVRVSEEAAKAAGTQGLPDATVKAALKLAHDRFHVLEEACSAGKAHH